MSNSSAHNLDRAGLAEAASLVISTQIDDPAITSMLQRKFRLTYAGAANVVDQLAALGILEAVEGQRPRVIVPIDQKRQAVAAVADARRYVVRRAAVSDEDRSFAQKLVYSALFDDLPDRQAREESRQIVQLLIDAGWRPTR